jgi:DNA adenine methylase
MIDKLKQILSNRTDIKILNKDGVIDWIFNNHKFTNKKEDDLWGKSFSNTNQWTTFLGEQILYEILFLLDKNPRRMVYTECKKSVNNKKLIPDFECDDAFYENKTRTYFTGGTAGEKLLMTGYKYSELNLLYNKPTYIVCMAYQELEAERNFMLFNPILDCHKSIVNAINNNNVYFIKASDLLLSYLNLYSNSYDEHNIINIQKLSITDNNSSVTNNDNIKYAPILKWAGGKRQIIAELFKKFPKNYNNYHEPFVGSMSVFLEMINSNFKFNKVFLSDALAPLINVYTTIKYNHLDLINELKKTTYVNNLENYNKIRKRFNEMKDNSICVELAAMFIFLNKTGFNGMYRENSSGLYNIPYGKQTNPCICNENLINKLNYLLNKIDIKLKACDFTDVLNNVSENDFVYLDPPYYDTFSSYTKDKFNDEQHIKLKNVIDELTSKKCKVILSNSDTEFIRNLYKNYDIIKIPVKRQINSDASKRKDIKYELLICNFKLEQ